jgi:putative heme-binding domain-containing protein
MRWGLSLVLAVALLTASPGLQAAQNYPPEPPPVAPTGPRTPAGEARGLHLPPGFEVQLVASEPDIIHPINIAFDARGRLWVTTSIEYPFPAKGPKTKDAVKVLEDFGPDGRARKITTWADNLNIPIGVLPLPGEALVHSIPDVWRMWDTTGAGKADRREVLLASIGYKDTHGMTGNFVRGFDGWVYATHGFFNKSTVRARDGSEVVMESGNTYRFRPDGTCIEHFTNGQVNPFGLCFDPLGNLYSCDCHSRPIYQLLRGAYYPSFGRPHDGLGFGPEMMQHSHGSTAIAGIVYYGAADWPQEFRDNVFIGNVVTNRVNRDTLTRHGSTYVAVEAPDFIRSDDPWFRPVCMLLGPDGALYIADFYNRIIGHYEVPLTHPGRDKTHGRIWRVVYRGPDGKGRPRAPRADWTKATADGLVQDLANPNFTVRLIATNELADRGKGSAGAVRQVMRPDSSPFQRMHGLWVLERVGALDEPTLEAAAHDPEAGVRVHAQRVLAERKGLSPAARGLVLAALNDPDAFVRRCAADALGRHPAADNLRPLLDLRRRVPAADTHLLHVVRMALRDQLLPPAVWDKVRATKWNDTDVRALADVALGVPSAEAADFLLANLPRLKEGPQRVEEYVEHIARYGRADATPAVRVCARAGHAHDLIFQAALVRAIRRGDEARKREPGQALTDWAQDVAGKLLASGQDNEIAVGIELAEKLRVSAAQGRLVALVSSRKALEAQRRAAAGALATIDAARHVALLGRVVEDPSEPLALREQLCGTLAATGRPEAREELLKDLASAPAKLQSAIAQALAGSRDGAEKLLTAVAAGKASARLLQEPAVRLRLEAARVPDLRPRLAKLTRGLPSADQKLQAVINQRSAGFARAKPDPKLGALVFEKSCALCHQIANKGAKIAPQLDGVGARGVDRLLEDILDPNRNVDQAFRSTTLTLTNGQILSGLMLREEGQILVMADAQGKEQRIPRDTVESRVVSQASPMPANFAEQLSEADLYHLLAFLLRQRAVVAGSPDSTTHRGGAKR